MSSYLLSLLSYAGINIILVASLNLINGYTGMFSLGHAGFMAVGAYTSAWITNWAMFNHPTWMLFWFPVSLLSGAITAGGVGFLVGLPSLRLKGDYLAVVTLGIGEIIRVCILNFEPLGGARGMSDIPHLSSIIWVVIFGATILYLLWRLIHSPYGRSWMSLREDEIASQAMGVSSLRYKTTAFVWGAAFAGIAGGLFAHELRYLNPGIFDFNRSFEITLMLVLGGLGNFWGAVISASALTLLKEALKPLQEITRIDFRMIIYALVLISVMIIKAKWKWKRHERT